MSLTAADQIFNGARRTLVLTSQLNITSIVPTFGLAAVVVNVSGQGFVVDSLCRFGTRTTPATFISTSLVLCNAPAQSSPGLYDVAISANTGAEWSRSSRRFTYVASAPRLLSMHPDRGPASGGTIVTAIGANFSVGADDGARCRFGAVVVAAQWVTPLLMTCTTPAWASSGPVAFSVSDNFVTFTAPINFTFDDDLVYSSVSPTNGTVLGGTAVIVSVANAGAFANDSANADLYCRFGPNEVVASFVSDQSLSCTAPAFEFPGSVRLTVSNNGAVDFTGAGIAFSYTAAPTLLSVWPTTAPANGQSSWVNLTGDGFVSSSALACRFSGAIVSSAIFVTSNAIRCRAPSTTTPGKGYIEVTSNGVDFVSGAVAFRWTPVPLIVSVTPRQASNAGGATLVTLAGSAFARDRPIRCRFGAKVVDATWLNDTRISCMAPPTSIVGDIAVDATDNGQDYTDVGVAFNYGATPIVTSIVPDHGWFGGGTTVTIIGQSLSNVTDCAFGSLISRATVRNATTATCRSPGAIVSDETVVVGVSVNDGAELLQSLLNFTFVDAPEIESFTPPSKAISGGGTTTTVIGRHFRNSTWLRFGSSSSLTPTVFVSSTELYVDVPSTNQSGSVSSSATTNRLDFSLTTTTFLYTPSITIAEVVPNHGGIAGGYVATISGAGFVDHWSCRCRFGLVVTPLCTFFSASMITCLVPSAMMVANVLVAVASNGVDFEGAGAFDFVADPVIVSLSPSFGLEAGGTSVVVNAAGVRNSTTLRCRFGTIVVAARFINMSTLACTTPTMNATAVAMSFTSNGQQWSPATTFVVDRDPSIMEITPMFIPLSAGGNQTLMVLGSNFVVARSILCRFALGSQSYTTSALSVSSTTVACPTPLLTSPGDYVVELSYDDIFWTEFGMKLSVLAQAPLAPTTSPAFGYAGVTIVTISGVGFVERSDMSCRFGSLLRLEGTITW